MSKKSQKQIERAAKKRAQKEAQRNLYQAYAEEGRKKGSKRAKSKKSLTVSNTKHPSGACPNTGCHACHPAAYNVPPYLRQLIARGHARWSPTLLKVVPATYEVSLEKLATVS